MLADALVMKEIVIVEDGKVFAKKNDKGRRRELKGMYALAEAVKNSELQENRQLRLFADLLIASLAGSRNKILHGRNVDYDSAGLSVKLILYILGLAAEISKYPDVSNSAKLSNSQTA